MKRSRIVAQCRQSAFGCTFAPVLDPDLVPTPLDDARDSRLVEVTPPAAPPRFRRLDLVRRFTGFALWVGWRRLRGGPSTIELAVAVRTLFESLGGLWIKLGQLVAMRRDLLPGDFCNELGRLQDRVTGFPGAVARAVVEADLGRTVDSLFSEFEDHPFAAASIGARRLTWNYVAYTVLKQSGSTDEQIKQRYEAEKKAWIDEKDNIAMVLEEAIKKMPPQP